MCPKYIINKNLLIVFLLGLTEICFSQGETSSASFGYNFIEQKPTIDLQFNRTTSHEASDKYEIKIVKDAFVLNPSSEVHLGAGTKTSENNIILRINTYYKDIITLERKSEWTHLYKINILSPQFSSDKIFSVSQAYIKLGFEYISYYSKRCDLGEIGFSLDANLGIGASRVDSLHSISNVVRITTNPSFYWCFLGKKSQENLPAELDPDFYYRGSICASYTYYGFLVQDNRITEDKSIGYFNIKVGYRFIRKMKLVLEYKLGRVEPKYENIHTLCFGISLVN